DVRGAGSRGGGPRDSRSGPPQSAGARARCPLPAGGARRRLARSTDRRPGFSPPDLHARRGGAGHRARGLGPAHSGGRGGARAASGRLGSSIAPMTVTVRLFAVLRERAGRDSIEVELEDGATVADALDQLSVRPELEQLLTRMPVRMAVNRDYADPGTRLAAGDELALVPPVSGGGGSQGHVPDTDRPLVVEALSQVVSRPDAGAIVSCQGTPRDVARLDYEAYGEMAERKMVEILRACVERHGLVAAAAEHRIGPVSSEEPSVIVSVSAAHREEA